jgi:hypothetical protein
MGIPSLSPGGRSPSTRPGFAGGRTSFKHLQGDFLVVLQERFEGVRVDHRDFAVLAFRSRFIVLL